MKYLHYALASILVLFVPIYGLLGAIASAIALDTLTGIFKSIKLEGWKSITSRGLSALVSKMLLYEMCVVFLFIIDRNLLNEFIIRSFGITFMFTKICSIILIYIELVSIKENIEASYKIDIWKLLKKLFMRAKEVKNQVDELT
jgi:hypothetical protein